LAPLHRQFATAETACLTLLGAVRDGSNQLRTVESMEWRLKKSRYQDLAGVGGEVLPPTDSPLAPIERGNLHVVA
jgi:hypothetical protein